MANVIVVAVIFIAVGAAVRYIIKEKKNGTKCIGCPAGGACAKKQGGTSGCSCGCGSSEK